MESRMIETQSLTTTAAVITPPVGNGPSWNTGKPPWLSAAAHAIDQHCGRRLRCPGCERSRRQVLCFWRVNGLHRQYRVIVRCPECAASLEM